MDLRHQLAVELFQLSRRWRVKLDERFKGLGLTKAAWAVLYWLSRTPEGISHNDLAEQIGVENSTLTRQISAMERQGLVERRPLPGDRRVKLVRITEKALPLLDQLGAAAGALRAELLEGVTPETLQMTVDLLRLIRMRMVDEPSACVGAGSLEADKTRAA